ncbi:unnamed protein product [Sphenostylis stenocarpa]|uniref:Uncharacterized protein n=1 Tax=Sphenostylis stenocarpa TaxID=92480 RepID=A0AA86SAW3_9FABA|nr:unnamed protein product [Sphenostylis stenocarpa]
MRRKGPQRAHALAVKANQCSLQAKLATEDSAIALLLLHPFALNRNHRNRFYGIIGVSVDVICCHQVHEILEIVLTDELKSLTLLPFFPSSEPFILLALNGTQSSTKVQPIFLWASLVGHSYRTQGYDFLRLTYAPSGFNRGSV